MLTVDEYHEVIGVDLKHYILCERLGMIPDIEQELLDGKIISYVCESTKDSVRQWQAMFEDLTKCSLCMGNSVKGTSYVVNRAVLLCQHYPRNHPGKRGISPRDIGCPFQIRIRLCKVSYKKNARSRSRMADAGYALRVSSNGVPHNHSVEAVLRQRRVSDATKSRLTELLTELRSPTLAWSAFRQQLEAELGDGFQEAARDASILPDRCYVYRLNRKLFGRAQVDARYRAHRRPRRPAGGASARPDRRPKQQQQQQVGVAAVNADGGPLPLPDSASLPDGWVDDDRLDPDDLDEPPLPPAPPPPPPPSPQVVAATEARRQLERFTEEVVGRIAEGDDWQLWARGVQTFALRWDTFSMAGRLALLRGARSAVRIKNHFYSFSDAFSVPAVSGTDVGCTPTGSGTMPSAPGASNVSAPAGYPGQTVCVLRP